MKAKINTPKEMPQMTVLEQTSTRIHTRFEFSNGFIMVTDMTSNGDIEVSSNYNWIVESDGSISPNYDSKNLDFIDPIHEN
ncbi:hypothetical protein ABVF11_02185 [Pediococcus argentinicus]|uniref:hypothetical protein n=1 Tax=Pediococcus argentinicus TaxID=480391 RepID=UPI00338F548B